MVRASVLLTALAAFAQAGAAQQAYQPPQPGTMITWKFEIGDTSRVRLSEVIASGDDFVVFDPDIQQSSGTPADFIVEFSALHSQACDQPLLSAEDRSALASVWPLTSGASASVRTGVSSTYKVGEETRVDIISDIAGAREAWKVESRYGQAAMQLAVSPSLGMQVRLDWPSGDSGHVLEVVEAQGAISPPQPSARSLGYCAELLQ